MGARGAQGPFERALSLRAWILVSLICVVGAIAYFLVQSGSFGDTAMSSGVCERLGAAGLTIGPKDWFCRSQASWRLSYSVASLVLGLAYVLPSMILARTGRRVTAALPLLVGISTGGANALGISLVPDVSMWLKAVSVIALVAPVAAVAAVTRCRPRGARPEWPVALVSALACGLLTWGVIVSTTWAYAKHYDEPLLSASALWSAAICIAFFGLLLGQDRRWWPWSIAPIAVLLSAGPSAALLMTPEGRIWSSLLGAAVPLAAIGLIWCAWTPISVRITARVARAEGIEPPLEAGPVPVVRVPRRSRPRSFVMLNALAAGVLAVSAIAFMADPLPTELSATLVTYSALRSEVAGVRVKMDLRMAVSAIDEYAARHGSYAGFDAKAGAALQPALAWTDWTGAADAPGTLPSQTMMIVGGSAGSVQIAALSRDRAFCIESTGSSISYGTSSPTGSIRPGARQLLEAVSNCDSTPWTDSAVRVPDISSLCEGMDPYGEYVMCRVMQADMVTTLRQTKPS